MKNDRSLITKTSRALHTLYAAHHRLDLGINTQIMGILNVTDDSFSKDGCLKQKNPVTYAVRRAKKFIRYGASIIDVGGESTRPGAQQISVKEEISRVIPIISALARSTQTLLSIDTYKPTVAKHALDAGAVIVNNIMGSKPNPSLLKMVRDYDAAIVLMHIQGTPRSMQKNIKYTHVVKNIVETLQNSVNICLDLGIAKNRIIVDPGIGFGKTVEHNLTILNQLSALGKLKLPILIGTSRKSFIGKVLNKESHQRLLGSLATISTSITQGAHIVRVHDVKETKEVVDITDAIMNETQRH